MVENWQQNISFNTYRKRFGGSAIAITPVIQSDEKQTSISLGVIFILNSIALFVFPATCI
jgi:hypothetical protein